MSVSDKDSNPSVGNGYFLLYLYLIITADAAGEELKQLKDFKALISEKTEPKSIKTLSRAMILLHLIIVALTCNKIFPIKDLIFLRRRT